MGNIREENATLIRRNPSITGSAKFRALCIYLLLLGWGPIMQSVPGLATLRLDEVLLPFMFLAFVLMPMLLGKRRLLRLPRIFIYTWGTYLVLSLLSFLGQSLLLGQERVILLVYLARLFYLTLLFYVAYGFLQLNKECISKTINLFMIISLGISVFGIMQWFHPEGAIRNITLQHFPRLLAPTPYVATSVFGGNPTILGTFLLMPIAFAFSCLGAGSLKTSGKIALFALLIVIALCLFLSAAKLAIITSVLVFAFLSMLLLRKGIKASVVALMALLVVVYLLMTLTPHIFPRILAGIEGSIQGRWERWGDLWQEISASGTTLIFGTVFLEKGVVPENQYFFELFHKGILGLWGYGIFLFGNLAYFLRSYFRATRDSYGRRLYLGVIGMLFAIMLISVGYTSLEAPRIGEWIFILLALGYAYQPQLKNKQVQPA